ncbi:MAG: pyrrolo-quinoline quinone [Gemmataceae bacterium]|nr:pyrrolo-quinoline quinone [Gemmataceae bacterium]
MGPNRDGVWNEKGIRSAFPSAGIQPKWKVAIGGGFAGPAVADGKVLVSDYLASAGQSTNDFNKRDERAGLERILCLDAANGKLLWKKEYNAVYKISYASGPRVTPTVSQEKVYTLGAEGNFFCLSLKDGSVIWQKDFKKDFAAPTPLWGFCGHPLVVGDVVYCLVGGPGSMAVALDKNTGKEIWRALSAKESGYCPPTLIHAGGVDQLLIWHAEALNSLDPKTGKAFWTIPLEPLYGMSICAPRLEGDLLFAGGIGSKAACIRLAKDKPAAEVVWRSDRNTAVSPANSTPFISKGIVYGCDCHAGWLGAFELATGKRLWEDFRPTTGKRATHGTAMIVKNGDHYYLASETGHLICAKLSAAGYEEVSRVKLLEPTNSAFGRDVLWCHPAFANKCIYWRNDKELACFPLGE